MAKPIEQIEKAIQDAITEAIRKSPTDPQTGKPTLAYLREKPDSSKYPDIMHDGAARDWKDHEHYFSYIICRCRQVGKGAHGCFGARVGIADSAATTEQFRALGT